MTRISKVLHRVNRLERSDAGEAGEATGAFDGEPHLAVDGPAARVQYRADVTATQLEPGEYHAGQRDGHDYRGDSYEYLPPCHGRHHRHY